MAIILDTTKPNILFFLIFIIFSTAQAQEKIAPPKPFLSRIEASAGINYSNPSGATFPSGTVEPKAGYILGLNASHDFSRIISLDLSVFYERKNSSTVYDIFYQSLTPPQNLSFIEKTGLNYLTIATAINFRLGRPSRFFIGIGGYYSFLRGVESSETGSYSSGIVKYYSYSMSTIGNKDYDTGLIFSLKYRYPLSERHDIHLQLLNCLGLNDITSDKIKSLPIKNNSYSILIGFTLKK